MKKRTPFDEVRPRTARDKARQREIRIIGIMEELLEIADEDEFKRRLAERFGILPDHPRYEKALTTWRELQRGSL